MKKVFVAVPVAVLALCLLLASAFAASGSRSGLNETVPGEPQPNARFGGSSDAGGFRGGEGSLGGTAAKDQGSWGSRSSEGTDSSDVEEGFGVGSIDRKDYQQYGRSRRAQPQGQMGGTYQGQPQGQMGGTYQGQGGYYQGQGQSGYSQPRMGGTARDDRGIDPYGGGTRNMPGTSAPEPNVRFGGSSDAGGYRGGEGAMGGTEAKDFGSWGSRGSSGSSEGSGAEAGFGTGAIDRRDYPQSKRSQRAQPPQGQMGGTYQGQPQGQMGGTYQPQPQSSTGGYYQGDLPENREGSRFPGTYKRFPDESTPRRGQ